METDLNEAVSNTFSQRLDSFAPDRLCFAGCAGQASQSGKLQGTVWVADEYGNSITVIDAAAFELHGTVPTGKEPAYIILTPDGKTAYTSNRGDNTVTAIDDATMKPVATIPVGEYPHGLRPSPDGKWVYVANARGTTLSMIDTQTNTKVKDIEVGQEPVQVGFSPDNKYVIAANQGTDEKTQYDGVNHRYIHIHRGENN